MISSHDIEGIENTSLQQMKIMIDERFLVLETSIQIQHNSDAKMIIKCFRI